MKKTLTGRKKHIKLVIKSIFWFSAGAMVGLFFLVGFAFIAFQHLYGNTVYPGVIIEGTDFGGKTKNYVETYFSNKNARIGNSTFVFVVGDQIATISAKALNMGYNSKLSAEQAYSIGRSNDPLSNINLILQAYISGVTLPTTYFYSEDTLMSFLYPIIQKQKIQPVDALFAFQNGRVTTFRPSSDGQAVDTSNLNEQISLKIPSLVKEDKSQNIPITLPIKTVKPGVTTDDANNLGIREPIGEGVSYFHHSISSRIYNISLAATRINGSLVAPGEEFSFDKALGDVSEFTGYKQAYVIQNGKTVLGDGGGVCQVSTTFFRALLEGGLPITERHAHAYRVGYYEENSSPGIDATIFVPSIDLKFRNNTGHSILIQTAVDLNEEMLTITLYGTKDGRTTTMTKPVIANQTPPPPDLYQDDPTIPRGRIQQTDFAAWGAHVYFTRQVIKNNKVMTFETFTSDYQPWQAVYLRGTKD